MVSDPTGEIVLVLAFTWCLRLLACDNRDTSLVTFNLGTVAPDIPSQLFFFLYYSCLFFSVPPLLIIDYFSKSVSAHLIYIYFLIYLFWLCWVFISVRGLSPVAASGGHSSSRCAGLSLSRPLLLRSTGTRRAGSVVVAHGPSRSAACGIFPDQDSNPCPLHWRPDSQPLRHQGSPTKPTFAQVEMELILLWGQFYSRL